MYALPDCAAHRAHLQQSRLRKSIGMLLLWRLQTLRQRSWERYLSLRKVWYLSNWKRSRHRFFSLRQGFISSPSILIFFFLLVVRLCVVYFYYVCKDMWGGVCVCLCVYLWIGVCCYVFVWWCLTTGIWYAVDSVTYACCSQWRITIHVLKIT